jgi:predicted nucleotidyltransferase
MVSATFFNEPQQTAIAEQCELRGVKRLDLFGSQVRQDKTPASDFDFLIEFIEPLRPGVIDDYLALRQSLTEVVGAEVDLVESSSIKTRICESTSRRTVG